MRGIRGIRVVLVVAGALLLGFGAWLLLSRQDIEQLFSVALWLAAVVVVHDGALAVVSAVRHRLLGRRRSAAASETNESAS